MKKTLALALVAAMAISMASMTAFAKTVEYSDETSGVWPEKSVATVTLKKDDCTKTTAKKYKATTDTTSYSAGDSISAAEYESLGAAAQACFEEDGTEDFYSVKFGDLKLKKFDNTATKTFYGWYHNDSADASSSEGKWKTDADPDQKNDVMKDDDVIDVTFSGDTATIAFETVGRTDTTDEAIAKNLENIEKAKKDGEDAEAEKNRIAELDKKYNADGKNGYDKKTKEDKELEGKATLKTVAEKTAQDFAWHAIQVAGVTDDAEKTWVYDVTLPENTALYAGKTARTTLTIDGVKGDLSKFGVKVYHIEGWCKAVPVKNVDVKGNTVTFWASDFSPYVVTIGDGVASTGAADASNPSTGDFSAVPVALLAAAALGATGFVAYKKRKAE